MKVETKRDLIETSGALRWRPASIDGVPSSGEPRLYRWARPVMRLLRLFRGLYIEGGALGGRSRQRRSRQPMTHDAPHLIEISHQILAAIQSRDRAAIERFFHVDFIHLGEAGRRHPRAQFIAAIEGADHRIERLSFDAISVEIVHDTAIVCGVQSGAIVLSDGQRIEGRTAFTDLFLRDGAGWQLRVATSTEL